MRRYLTWHIDRVRGDNGSQGPVYYADHDYAPGAIRLSARQAPAQSLVVDIQDDGVSILTGNYAALNKGGTLEEHAEDYSGEASIEAGSAISFHIVRTGGAEDITCTLELESLGDEDDETE